MMILILWCVAAVGLMDKWSDLHLMEHMDLCMMATLHMEQKGGWVEFNEIIKFECHCIMCKHRHADLNFSEDDVLIAGCPNFQQHSHCLPLLSKCTHFLGEITLSTRFCRPDWISCNNILADNLGRKTNCLWLH